MALYECRSRFLNYNKRERSANMAKMVSFVVCDAINNVLPDGETNVPALISPQITLRPQFIPGNFSFGISVGVAGVDLRKENRVRMTISDPKENLIQVLGDNELPKAPDEDTMPLEFQGFTLIIDVRNLPIQCEGEYIFSLFLNGERIGTQKIPVFKRA